MKNVKSNSKNQIVNAILKKDIAYTKKGLKILVPSETQILVDLESSVALIAGDHVDIIADEYQLT